jgi:hypothetical protein
MNKLDHTLHELELGLYEMDQEAIEYWSASNLMR